MGTHGSHTSRFRPTGTGKVFGPKSRGAFRPRLETGRYTEEENVFSLSYVRCRVANQRVVLSLPCESVGRGKVSNLFAEVVVASDSPPYTESSCASSRNLGHRMRVAAGKEGKEERSDSAGCVVSPAKKKKDRYSRAKDVLDVWRK